MEEVITTIAASAAADQKKTQDMVESMLLMMKEKRKKPDTDVDLDYDSPLWPTAGSPRWVANTMQESVRAAQDRLVYRQAGSVRAKEATLKC